MTNWLRRVDPVVLLVGEPPALETAVERCYETHASEEHGRCLTPYIDGSSKLDVAGDHASKQRSRAAIWMATV